VSDKLAGEELWILFKNTLNKLLYNLGGVDGHRMAQEEFLDRGGKHSNRSEVEMGKRGGGRDGEKTLKFCTREKTEKGD